MPFWSINIEVTPGPCAMRGQLRSSDVVASLLHSSARIEMIECHFMMPNNAKHDPLMTIYLSLAKEYRKMHCAILVQSISLKLYIRVKRITMPKTSALINQ